MTPAERLLAAADLLDKRAGDAARPWKLTDDNHLALQMIEMPYKVGPRVGTAQRFNLAGPDDATTAYIATMHPEVGKALAAWLRRTAQTVDREVPRLQDAGVEMNWYGWGSAVALADLILAGESQ